VHLNRLDLNLLVALDALLGEQSVTKAANRLSLSQPAMSGALTRLREHFKDELITRVGRTMVLTPFGASIAPRVGELLGTIARVTSARPGFDPPTTDRNFTLATSDYGLAVFLPLVIPRIIALAPHVTINTQLISLDQEERLAAGLIDIVIVPRGMGNTEHPSTALFQDEYVCIVWEGNTSIGAELTLDKFLRAQHVVRTIPRAKFVTLEEMQLNKLGYERHVTLRVPSFEMLPRAIVGTPLIASMQRRLAEQSARQHPIRIVPHPVRVEPLTMIAQWPQFRDDDPGSLWLRKLIVETAMAEFGPPDETVR
jgi:DNA-binding transcriptional LysR family regulator